MTLAQQVKNAIVAAGVAITDISIGDANIRSTWKVSPANLQAAAQPTIDAFNPADPATVDAAINGDADATVAEKDLLATIALIVSRTDANWNTYTLAQKKTAVQGAVTTWKSLRSFVEKNL